MSDDHHHPAPTSDAEERLNVLEALLIEKGILDPAAMDSVLEYFERDVGPMNGAKVVARAWSDHDYKARLLANPNRAIAELGFGYEGEHVVVVENTPHVHNVVVCTLCSCYPWSLLGLPPAWYKSEAYRSRMVREPRQLLAEMGCSLPEDVEIRVWDSSAEVRYLILPDRPDDGAELDEDALAGLVSRDSMIGVERL